VTHQWLYFFIELSRRRRDAKRTAHRAHFAVHTPENRKM
jgi:hypothetical protein